MGSNYYPFGPHGERNDPREVTQNPTAQGSFPNIGGGDDSYQPPKAPAGGYGGSSGGSTGACASGGGVPFGGPVTSFLFLAILWEVWACLYPLAAFAGAAAMSGAVFALQSVLPPEPEMAVNPFAWLIALALGVGVAGVVSRFVEHPLARYAIYRIARHVVRLVLFAGLILNIVDEATGIPADFTSIAGLIFTLSIPANLGAALAAIAGMQVLLWKGDKVREFWHRRLVAVGIRKEMDDSPTEPADLPIKPIWD